MPSAHVQVLLTDESGLFIIIIIILLLLLLLLSSFEITESPNGLG